MSLDQRIYDVAVANGMPDQLARLITAQAKHETADYTSNIFNSCNNLFGYKYVGQQLATRCSISPEFDYYARYATIDDSVIEICRWINRRQKDGSFPADLNSITTADQYASLLKNAGYFTDTITTYLNGLKYYLAKISITTAASSGLVIIAAALLIIFRKQIFG